jgi:hypothetical protein
MWCVRRCPGAAPPLSARARAPAIATPPPPPPFSHPGAAQVTRGAPAAAGGNGGVCVAPALLPRRGVDGATTRFDCPGVEVPAQVGARARVRMCACACARAHVHVHVHVCVRGTTAGCGTRGRTCTQCCWRCQQHTSRARQQLTPHPRHTPHTLSHLAAVARCHLLSHAVTRCHTRPAGHAAVTLCQGLRCLPGLHG